MVETDDADFDYEYDGPPLALADDVAVSMDKDVNLIVEAEPTNTINPTSSTSSITP